MDIKKTLLVKSSSKSVIIQMKDQVATEGKNNIVYEIDCISCEAVYFSESKQS